MKHTNKKGFTIVELVIVIAVIAILAAVLIPTFSNLIKKANLSADQQAVRQMNTVLAAEGAVKKNNIFEVYDALAESGFSAENYKPLTKNAQFVWDAELDRILLVEGNTVLYPTDYKDLNGAERTWKVLSTENVLTLSQPEGFTSTSTSVVVNTAEEYAYVVNEFNKGATASNLTIDLNGKTLDLKGASMVLANEAGGYVKNVTVTLKNGTIKNIVNIDAAYQSATQGGEGRDGLYNCGGLFGMIEKATVVVENIVVEDVSIRNTHVSGAGIIAATVSSQGSLTLNNVTVKNSTVIAHRNEGALIGFVASGAAKVEFNGNINLENVSVLTVGGRSGLLVGYVLKDIEKGANLQINLTNCKYEIYNCEQNTGTFEGTALGLQADGLTINSYAYNTDYDKNMLENKKFVAGAYATATDAASAYTGLDSVITVH